MENVDEGWTNYADCSLTAQKDVMQLIPGCSAGKWNTHSRLNPINLTYLIPVAQHRPHPNVA